VNAAAGTFADRLARGDRARFGTFLGWFAIACALIGGWNIAFGASYADPVTLVSGVFIVVYAGIVAFGRYLARSGDMTRSARLVAGGVLAINAVLIAMLPQHRAVLLLLPFIAVAIAVAHVGRKELAAIELVAWLECVWLIAAATTGTFGDAPAIQAEIRSLTAPAIVAGFIMALTWLYKVRAEETLAAIRNREEAAQAARTRYRSLFDGNPVGLFRATSSGSILDANPALARALGVGHPSAIVGDRVAWLDDDLVAEAGTSDIRSRVVETVRPDGSAIWLRLSIRAIPATGPGDVVLEGSAEDITEQRRTEERLIEAVKLESVGRLAGGVAHDFNNLLTAIRGFASLLDADLDPLDVRRDSVREITRAADRASNLTAQLLAVGRRQMLQTSEVDLAVLVHDLLPMLRRVVGDAVAVSLEVEPSVGAVRADASQLERVLTNLAANARDAMPAGGTLALRLSSVDTRDADASLPVDLPAGAWVELRVSDTGTGMDEETRRRAFEPFFTTKGHGKGTGLGLATVYGVVSQSGGLLELESTPGLGTTFRIFLPQSVPAILAPAAEATMPTLVAVPSAPARPTILLVEDDRQVLALSSRVLARDGYHVVARARGDEAAEIDDATLASIDLLVTDVVMPGLDGPSVVRALTARRPGLPFLLVSGYAESAVLDPALRNEPTFLAKPYTPDALLERVRTILADREAAAA
jgi:PAS domain S-box-containing protein